ncbi:MAG: hypothetical protein EX254_09675 [Flavobacteriaceae bacterium]|nr:hypothetical protein [Bacteroidia bacterium]NND10208.1 hypothetical protein [Flavobacteriaceae bacterium]NNL60469.1 hypothetical protein [Flavobacteriaceae bacterium]RZV59536.1 MAG: hypothetical protein EX254_09675 [Flavobacteriaceae bacterium]
MKYTILSIALIIGFSLMAQEELPYYEIPKAPEQYNAGTVAARMIDGLGFRYYWATEGLRDEDLSFRPNEDARTTSETVDHLYGLSKVIKNAALKKPNIRGEEEPEFSFSEKRAKTLENIKIAADILRVTTDLTEFTLVFKNENGSSEYPFWNNINGPIADAIWHCGQVVLLRRSSGNPFNSNVSVFTGKLRNQ